MKKLREIRQTKNNKSSLKSDVLAWNRERKSVLFSLI